MRDEINHPWIAGGVTISDEIMKRVHEEALAAYARDEESCGLLVGPAAQPMVVDGIVPMENRANKLHALDPETYPRTARMYFDIDPMKFEKEIKKGEAAGRPAKVLYHSHLDVGAYFSETDAAAACAGGSEPTYDLAYLVTSVQKGAIADFRLFVWDRASSSFKEGKMSVPAR